MQRSAGGGCYIAFVTSDVMLWIWQACRPAFPATVVGYTSVFVRNTFILIRGIVPSLVALLAYGLLTRWFGSHADGEPHCRRCDHILRGLSEPRCPECGEGI